MYITKDFLKRQKQGHWRNSSPKAGYTRNQLSDDDYYDSLALNDPLWRYIISHYPKEVYGENRASVVVLGYKTLAVAIELTQWSYPVIFIARTYDEVKRAKRDCEIHAGSLKENIYFDYLSNIKRAHVVTFTGILDEFHSNIQVYRYLDMLLLRTGEVVCAVEDDRDWVEILRDKYDFEALQYPDKKHRLLTVRQLTASPSSDRVEN